MKNPFETFNRDAIKDARDIKDGVKQQETHLSGTVSKLEQDISNNLHMSIEKN
jgi:hypothetical protein